MARTPKPTPPPPSPPQLGAYFLSLTVENLRCFVDAQTLPLDDGHGRPARWTILLGENGTGKSTLLQCLAAMRPDPARLRPPRSDEGYVIPMGHGGRGAKLTGLLDFDNEGTVSPMGHEALRDASCSGSGKPDLGIILSAKIGFSAGPLQVPKRRFLFDLKYQPLSGPAPGFGPGPPYFTFGIEDLKSCVVGYGPFRRPGNVSLSGELPDSVAGLFSLDTQLINAEEWYLQRDYQTANPRLLAADRAHAEQVRDRIEALLIALLPGVTGLLPVVTDPTNGTTRLHANTADGFVPIASLGLGYQSTMAWVVDLAARMLAAYPHSDNPLHEPGVVLIDEIDLHLHPKWQRTLLHELTARFPNVQFVATAHSPLIVQAAPDANIVLLRRKEGRLTIERAPEEVRSWRVEQLLTSDLFDLPTTRPATADKLIARRDTLLAKAKLTAQDKKELATLRAALAQTSPGESPLEMEAMELIRRAAAEFKAAGGS